MCNPTLAVSALSAGMQYQQAITQQKNAEMQAKRQNEIALANEAEKAREELLEIISANNEIVRPKKISNLAL